VRYNSAGGWVEVLAGDGPTGATIIVRNSGPRVPAEEVARLFRPFQRLERGRTRHATGHGLGLAIVSAIATAHGADLETRPRPTGGLDVEVHFRTSMTDRSGRAPQALREPRADAATNDRRTPA